MFFSQSQSHGGIVINEYVGYALAHKGRADDPNNVYSPVDEAEAYTNPNAYEKMAEYTSHARARHGDDFDPATEPLDTEILMRREEGSSTGGTIWPTTPSTRPPCPHSARCDRRAARPPPTSPYELGNRLSR